MDLGANARTSELRERLESFMDEHVYPNEARYFSESAELGPWAVWPIVEELKPLAREAGLHQGLVCDAPPGRQGVWLRGGTAILHRRWLLSAVIPWGFTR